MKLHVICSLAVACLTALIAPANAKADLVGTTATVTYDYPTLGTVLTSGGTAPITLAGASFSLFNGGVNVGVGDSNLNVFFLTGFGFANAPKTFDGIVFSDPTAKITAVSLIGTNVPNFTAADLSFDAHDVYINFSPYSSFSTISKGSVVSVGIAETPEPSSWALLSTGLCGAALLYRRRQLVNL